VPSIVVDAGFLVAFLNRRDAHHEWALAHAPEYPPPWRTCEAALVEAFHLVGARDWSQLDELLRNRAVVLEFDLQADVDRVLDLMKKYNNVPMSLADACLVRMTEIIADPIVMTTDSDFVLYRRHGRQVVPCVTP
jgi:predicted nucleic acid-binding protein